jgi:hypothetical protein
MNEGTSMEGAEMLHELILAAVRAQRHTFLMTPIILMILKLKGILLKNNIVLSLY